MFELDLANLTYLCLEMKSGTNGIKIKIKLPRPLFLPQLTVKKQNESGKSQSPAIKNPKRVKHIHMVQPIKMDIISKSATLIDLS